MNTKLQNGFDSEDFEKMVEKLPVESDPGSLERLATEAMDKANAIREADRQKAIAEEQRTRMEKLRLQEEQQAKSRRNQLRQELYPKVKAISDSGVKIDNELLLAHIIYLEDFIVRKTGGNILRIQMEDLFEIAKTGWETEK